MCGPDLPAAAYVHRVGALAVLSPAAPGLSTRNSPDSNTTSLSGILTFFNSTDDRCQMATHMRFVPSHPLDEHSCRLLFVNIHQFGTVSLAAAKPVPSTGPGPAKPVLRRLDKPLHLHVGEDKHGNSGIIGRRITLCAMDATAPEARTANPALAAVLAEGIVGFNSLPRLA